MSSYLVGPGNSAQPEVLQQCKVRSGFLYFHGVCSVVGLNLGQGGVASESRKDKDHLTAGGA